MAVIPMTGVLSVELETAGIITSAAGAASLPAYLPRAFVGDITVVGAVVHIMRGAVAQSGNPIQVFRIDEVVST
jgi:hypothetical protein